MYSIIVFNTLNRYLRSTYLVIRFCFCIHLLIQTRGVFIILNQFMIKSLFDYKRSAMFRSGVRH